MHNSILTRGTTTLGAVLLLTLGMLAYAAGAQAAPGTVTGPNISMTVDDTTPAPGQTIRVDLSDTLDSADIGAASANFELGHSPGNGGLANLYFDSCGGGLSNCAYNAGVPASAFTSDVATGALGDTVGGSATFTVSTGAAVGAFIEFAGRHISRDSSGTPIRDVRTDDILLRVAAPDQTDLGVGLTATAGGLLSSHVDYDAAVTNKGPLASSSATIVTQLPSQATGATSSTCIYASSTDQVSCPIGTLANGATTHARFTATFGLLTIGLPLHATATRTASSPIDPNPSNDSDSADCTAITSLLIGC